MIREFENVTKPDVKTADMEILGLRLRLRQNTLRLSNKCNSYKIMSYDIGRVHVHLKVQKLGFERNLGF